MYKPSIAVLVSSLSALSYQAEASQVINIDSSKVSDDLANAITEQCSNINTSSIINSGFVDFCTMLNLDGEKVSIDIAAYLTSGNQDSTNVSVGTGISSSVSSCYNNCYNNCHASRSWR